MTKKGHLVLLQIISLIKERRTMSGNPDSPTFLPPGSKRDDGWPVYGLTALRLRTTFPNPETGEDVPPSQENLDLANFLLHGEQAEDNNSSE